LTSIVYFKYKSLTGLLYLVDSQEFKEASFS
jgi:hypothetical protein